jgi:protein O-mannosyl-transferase
MRRKPIKSRPPTSDDPARASTPPSDRPGNILAPLGVCAFLLAAVLVVFYQTTSYDFVNFDDADYVYRNATVTKGLTWEGIRWAFTERRACANWHPLTWLSHELDCSIYGPHQPMLNEQSESENSLFAGGHHLTSVLLHAAAAIVLFLALWRMTDAFWPSAFVAAVFAVHPLRAESVAWVAERKDVLSGLFFMLTLAAYVGYVRHPFSLIRYLSVIVLFALGLMAKPMLVTLPFVLLLLDYWPLGRMSSSGWRGSGWRGSCTATPGAAVQLPLQQNSPRWQFVWPLVIEKIPLLLLTAASCIVTPLAQGKAVAAIDVVPISARATNALVAYVAYIRDLIFPLGLAVYYPHPGANLPIWKVIAAALVLVGVSTAVVIGRRKYPYLFVGWFWYVGMLVPVIGLVQVGRQAMADRYTYLPQIGLGIAVAWGAAELTRDWPRRRWACGVASALIVTALMACAWRQTEYWRDSVTLWKHTLECTERNPAARANLGAAMSSLKQYEEAVEQLREALVIDQKCLPAQYNLGLALFHLHQPNAAIEHYRKALELDDKLAQAHYRLAEALLETGKRDEAIAEFRKALHLEPDNANACYNVAVILEQKGEKAAALKAYRQTLALQPNDVTFLDQLAWILATCPDPSLRNGQEAVQLAERAVELTNGNVALVYGTLAAAYAEAGRFREAVAASQRAIALALEKGDKQSAAIFGIQMKFYQGGTPYRERDERPR